MVHDSYLRCLNGYRYRTSSTQSQVSNRSVLCRPSRLRVVDYMPAERAFQSPNVKPVEELHLVHSTEEKAFKGFKQYLKGFRGVGRDTSQPKLAVVRTQSYSLLLGCPDGHQAATSAVSCWVI